MSGPSSELKSVLYRAGAGAGKTRTLINRVLEIALSYYQQYQKYPNLVVTTFTRKATQEIRERLLSKVQEPEWSHLQEFVLSKTHLQISTIHGVLGILLSRFGHQLNLDTEFRVIDESQNERSARRVLKRILRAEVEFQILLEEYSFEELTRLLMRLSALQIQWPEIRPYSGPELQQTRISMLRQYAGEAKNLADEILSSTTNKSWVEWASGMRDAAEAPISSLQDILAAQVAVRAPNFSSKAPPFDVSLKERIGDFRAEAKARLGSLELDETQIEGFVRIQLLIEKLSHQFSASWREAKAEQGWISMSDLELTSLDCLRKNPLVSESFSQDWDYWFIDEYQDTSPLQVQLIELLRGDRESFIVGDPQQSIYYFRGARSEVFYERLRDFESRGHAVEFLQTNYRSQPELLLFLNDLFRPFGFLSMTPRALPNPTPPQVATVAWAPDEATQRLAVTAFIQDLLAKGVPADRIAVLGRTNQMLSDLARHMEERGIPTHIHASGGYYDRREVLDALAMLKFLVNPHDDKNLIELVRSPYLRIQDEILVDLRVDRNGSLWSQISSQSNPTADLQRLLDLRGEVDSLGITGAFENGLVKFGFIDLSHTHDVTGRRESNLWKLVTRLRREHHRPGFSFLEFISEGVQELSISDGGEESEAIACAEPERVNFMTIHQSKGLEFDHVVLPDLHKALNTTKFRELYVDEESQRWSLAVRLGEPPTQKHLAPGLKIRQRIVEAEAAESLRVLYVAMTRAMKSIFLSAGGSGRGQNWRQQIQSTLAGMQVGENLPYTIQKLEGPWDDTLATGSEEKHLSVRDLFSIVEAPIKESTSATEMIEAESKKRSLTGAPPSVDRIQKAVGGTHIHRILEAQKYVQDPANLTKLMDRLGSGSQEFLRGWEFLQTQQKVPLQILWKSGFPEWGFLSKAPTGQVIQGQIDLWGVVDQVIWIVDYKTGSPAYAEKALHQLKIYRWALAQFGYTGQAKLTAVFPLSQKLEIWDAPTADVIIRELGWA